MHEVYESKIFCYLFSLDMKVFFVSLHQLVLFFNVAGEGSWKVHERPLLTLSGSTVSQHEPRHGTRSDGRQVQVSDLRRPQVSVPN